MEEVKRLLRSGLSVGEVAEKLGYFATSNFSQGFMQRMGCTPTEWMRANGIRSSTAERVARAESLMLVGDNNLRQVAKMVGFNSQQALNMAFNAVHGVSPTKWIKQHRTNVKIEVRAIPMVHRKKRKN